MKHAEIIQNCIRLEAKLDSKLFKVYRDETGRFVDESGAPVPVTTADKVKAGITATTIGGGAGILGVRALKRRYGANMAADPQKAGQALMRGVGRDVTTAGKAVASTATGALDRLKKSGLLNRAGRILRGVTRFDARTKLVELAAK